MLTFRSAEQTIADATRVRKSDWTQEVLNAPSADQLFSQARALVGQRAWAALSSLLDATGKDTLALIIAAALAYLRDLLDQLGPTLGHQEIERVLRRYEDAADAAPEDSNLAALAALAHLSVGAAWGQADKSDQAWIEVTHHARAASARLKPFTSHAATTPSLALATRALADQLETLSDLAWPQKAS